MPLRNCTYLPALTLSLLGSVTIAQEQQNLIPDQPGQYRVVTGRGEAQAQEMTPAPGGMNRFWTASRGPASAVSIGVYVSPVPAVMSSQLRLRKGTGLVVEGVVPGSAAEHAGLRQFDVIERINNRSVASVGQVEQMLRSDKPGDRVPLLIIREGDRQNIEVAVEGGPQWQQSQRLPNNFYNLSPQKYFPETFRFTPDQTRELEQMSNQLRKEVEQQEKQIERLKENLRREADQARRELEQLKDQIRSEIEQQKKQMLDQLKSKPDKSDQEKSDEGKPDDSKPRQY